MPKGTWREFDDALTQEPSIEESNLPSKDTQKVTVSKAKSGRAGKIVTIISGLKLKANEAKSLLKALKTHCGTGGTWKLDVFELQGNQVNDVLTFLEKQGYRPKKAGG
tara:strand:- start:15770 stop:16093 length:324 start_codon:yes stop_codon:yes gene_type:complete